MTFDEWYESQQPRFHSGHFNETGIALAAWNAGQQQFRADAAAALAELRAKIATERSALYGFVVEEIDATIAKLGLKVTQ